MPVTGCSIPDHLLNGAPRVAAFKDDAGNTIRPFAAEPSEFIGQTSAHDVAGITRCYIKRIGGRAKIIV